ncbi:MAG: efflux RND transporter periplasmic adaptor subunit [Deltaproteobacteria bacterium]|nr:efflux RND transporter periplasmic adaptor subunit [Deltaproteobacteria bacterium]
MKKIVPILLVLFAVTAYVYFARIRPSREKDPVVRGSGTIEATTVVVAAKIPARITAIAVAEGDEVKAGQVLATLQCDEPEARLAQAKAAVAQAEAVKAQTQAAEAQARAQSAPFSTQQRLAAKERERAVSLFKSAGATQRTVDQAESALQSVGEQVQAAGMAIDVARRAIAVAAAQVEVAQKNLQLAQTLVVECTLTAPIAGVVLAKNHEVGELVLPGSSLLKLGALDEVYTWIYVPNEEIGRVRLGQTVTLVADTYPDKSFAGHVARISEAAEFTPKSIQTKEDRTRLVFGVKVTIANPGRLLFPGMPVEARVEGTDVVAAPTAPTP